MRDIHTSSGSKSSKKKGVKAETDDEMPQLGTTELMSLVRRGAQTLAHPEIDVNEMLEWDWETMLSKCKENSADQHIKEDSQQGDEDTQEAEQQWLSSMEKVESYVLDGQKYSKKAAYESNADVATELNREARRAGKNTTVMVDGFAISKESMLCQEWEAVPTLAGKDPRLAEVKRQKKATVINQDVSKPFAQSR